MKLFQNQQLVWCRHFADVSPEHLEQLMEDHQVKHAIASNVSARSMSAFLQVKGFVLLSPSLKMPFENLYASPETLGADRMALAAATQFFHKGKNCMVFDREKLPCSRSSVLIVKPGWMLALIFYTLRMFLFF